MRKFLMTLAVLSICINAAWAGSGPHGGNSHPSSSRPHGGNSHSGSSRPHAGNGSAKPRPTHGTQKGKQGKASKHTKHSGKWRGWKKKHFSQHLGCYLYWSADDSCWYRYDEETGTFDPCDDLTDEDLID